MTDILTLLKNADKPIVLYGTGKGADKILDRLYSFNIKVSGVFASDSFVRSRTFRGFEVISFEETERRFKDFIVLFSFGSSRPEVIENIKRIMKKQTVLMADVSVYGNEHFDLSYAKKHRQELETVYNLLADEQSKKVFEETIKFKIDGDITRLFNCESIEDEAFENILKLCDGDNFLDLGAYNGDTILDFANRVKNYGAITGVEPDRKTFQKLIKNTQGLNVKLINAAVSSKCGSTFFEQNSSRGSNLGKGEPIDLITIDSLNDKFDFIKFDVEGQELNAIIGGEKTIREQKPKMLISAYHRAEDYFSIPLKVLEINPNYKIFMRHYPYVPAWDTNFYFV